MTLCGWVHRRRDHGGVISLICVTVMVLSVVIDPDTSRSISRQLVDKARSEFVLKLQVVRRRYEGTENANMVSGQIEVLKRNRSSCCF